MWDIFISHASEDKATVARPLAEELKAYGFRVWLDAWTLSPGDSLRRKIDEGISRSRLGVVVLSHAFFAKPWPQVELDAIYTMSVSGKRALVPIWHGLSSDAVTDYSPLLASLLALSTGNGIDQIAEAIAKKLGPIGRPLSIDVDPRSFSVLPGLNEFAASIRESEDVPGSYAKRRIVVSFQSTSPRFSEEIQAGVRLLITFEPLTFPVRTDYYLAQCIASYLRLYDQNADAWSGTGKTRLDLWRREDDRWYTGVYVTAQEASHICRNIGIDDLAQLRGGYPNSMLDLGWDVLGRKGIPKILFEFFRRQQRDSQD
jgi:hypothetical protein